MEDLECTRCNYILILKDWVFLNCVGICLYLLRHFMDRSLQYLDTRTFNYFECTYNLYAIIFLLIVSLLMLFHIYKSHGLIPLLKKVEDKITTPIVIVIIFSYEYIRHILNSKLNISWNFNIIPLCVLLICFLILFILLKNKIRKTN